MDNEVEACSECVCDHVRRSLAGIGNLLMEIRRNTVSEIDPSRRPIFTVRYDDGQNAHRNAQEATQAHFLKWVR